MRDIDRNIMKLNRICLVLLLSVAILATTRAQIQPSARYPQYWSYQGVDMLLLGGSVEDNLFQIDSLTQQLDLLASVGGNYVRNTMSSRDPGNEWPFHMLPDGKYDLNQFNPQYWDRFERFLRETGARNIIVQLELWATFDFYRENWLVNPFNPNNNINYNLRRSKLDSVVESHPVFTENNFFRSVPEQMNLGPVLWYQKLFVDKLLSYSLEFDHVLYCMDNETSVSSDWGKFWSRYIQKAASLKNRKVQTTEMWDPHNLAHPMHFETFDNPDIFSFVDISQNNHQDGDDHWINGLRQFEYLTKMLLLRPVNNVKIYGNDGGPHQTTRNAIESFCKNVFIGAASARFHRPPSGQGLNERAQSVIRSMRMIVGASDFFKGVPANHLLQNRAPNEAFCRAITGEQYLIYFPDGGDISLAVGMEGTFLIRWLDVMQSTWQEPIRARGADGTLNLIPPSSGHWIAFISKPE
ncbi:MAG: hypothetical protein HKN76_03675 [Saprospiraceae bacterium]|nr:hypothetical protein [Saprospiraceae bacterium]